jgi:hypothetical protein
MTLPLTILDFLPVLLGLAGITDRNRQRELNLVNSCTSMIGALSGESSMYSFLPSLC